VRVIVQPGLAEHEDAILQNDLASFGRV
jgi:hypothetical protein